jgi:hypothetical protein
MNNIYGIRDAANVEVIRKSDGKPYIYSDYATEVANDWKHDSVYAMSKSTKAIRWDYNKESTLKLTLEVFDLKWLTMLTGSEFVKGVTDIRIREVLTVGETSTGVASLSKTPKTGTLVMYTLDSDNISHVTELTAGTPATTENTYNITSLAVTFNTASCPDGTKVVAYYLADSEATAQTMAIKSNTFSFPVEIYMDSMIRDTDGLDKFVKMHYLNARGKGNFTLTFSANAITKLEIEFDLLKDSSSDDMATYTII